MLYLANYTWSYLVKLTLCKTIATVAILKVLKSFILSPHISIFKRILHVTYNRKLKNPGGHLLSCFPFTNTRQIIQICNSQVSGLFHMRKFTGTFQNNVQIPSHFSVG